MPLDLSTISRSQRRTETMLQHPVYAYQVHRFGMDGEDEELDEEQREIIAELADRFAITDWEWITDRIFATYEEAQAYGQSNRHNDGDDGKGWRVYAKPSMGSLRELLEKATAP